MTIPDRWKQPPLQAAKDDKKMTQEELVAKLLSAGLARSSMEAKEMASSMLNIEKTQQQFEREITKVNNLPRQQKTVNVQNLAVRTNEKVDSGVSDSSFKVIADGNERVQAQLISQVAALNEHIARQQQVIERLEQDVAFIRSTLQNVRTDTGTVYPKTPTASELLDQKESETQKPETITDGDAESFISSNK